MEYLDVVLALCELIVEVACAAVVLGVLVTGARVVWWLLTVAFHAIHRYPEW